MSKKKLPKWARKEIEHLLEHVMVTDYPHGERAATEAEWKAVFDGLSHMVDPDYDDGWREVPVLTTRLPAGLTHNATFMALRKSA